MKKSLSQEKSVCIERCFGYDARSTYAMRKQKVHLFLEAERVDYFLDT